MRISPMIKKLANESNIVPLVATTLVVFLYLLLLISFNYVTFLHTIESNILQGELDSRKMRLISELMEIARSRTRITNQIIDLEDRFEQDALNIELHSLASQFAALREELLGLQLDDTERDILLKEHPQIIEVILPAQRQAVELAMSGKEDELRQARKILYETVYPGQGRMLDSLGKMITLEQSRIENLANTTLDLARQTRSNSYILIVVVVGIILIMSVSLVMHIRRMQKKLILSHQNLEQSVRDRTEELRQARDALQQHVDLVDKYVITSRTDADGIITYASQAFSRISQYEQAELLGKAHRIVRHPDMPASLYDELWKTIKQGKVWHGEIKNRAKDGSAYWVDVIIEPEFDEDGGVCGYMAIRQDITDKKHIEELSITDPLTQIYNRLKLDESLRNEIGRARRYSHALSIILFDVDHFKQVNDTYGHQTGDDVLVEIATVVKQTIRNIDVAGRWGGEEFLVICPETGQQGASELAERLRVAIAGHEFAEAGHIYCSFGVATATQDLSHDEFLAEADAALYRAKKTGRNRVIAA
ncbi:MAG: diguanylate cyclase [Chromatiales bacterium]|jgi:diguanylate cyclase (GGDEF)-like protein/PAS domain S-box-containing protein